MQPFSTFYVHIVLDLDICQVQTYSFLNRSLIGLQLNSLIPSMIHKSVSFVTSARARGAVCVCSELYNDNNFNALTYYRWVQMGTDRYLFSISIPCTCLLPTTLFRYSSVKTTDNTRLSSLQRQNDDVSMANNSQDTPIWRGSGGQLPCHHTGAQTQKAIFSCG